MLQKQKRPPEGSLFSLMTQCGLHRVVKIKLDRMSGHVDLCDFFTLQLDVGIQHVVGEYTTLGEELTILLQGIQGFGQRSDHGRDLFGFFRRQVVQILVGRVARVDLVLDTVQAGHQQCRKAQVGVGCRVREACFNTTCFRAGGVRNTQRSGTVTGRVSQHNRSFKARYQTLVGVGRGVADRVQRLGVLDDTADVVQRVIAQTTVAVTGEDVGTVLGHGQVHVHAGTVVTHQRLGHEGSGLAVRVSHVVYAVLQDLYFVRFFHQGVATHTDLALAGGSHFVVVYFDGQAHAFHGITHRRTQVMQRVDRRNREVAALDARTVAGIAAFDLVVGRPGRFFGLDAVTAAADVGMPFNTVENEEFGFRAQHGGVGDAGRLQVLFGAAGNGARVTLITLTGRRLDDVTAHDDGSVFGEGIQYGSTVVRAQDHVGFLDAFPASDGGTIEHLALFKEVVAHVADRDGDVLFLALEVGEAHVDPLSAAFFDQIQSLL